MTDALKPCPFCGSTDLVADRGTNPFYICKGCNTFGPNGLDAWNTRADTATPAPAVPTVKPSLAEINRIADVMMKEWYRVDPKSNVTLYPASYVANFTDMARAVLSAITTAPADPTVKPLDLDSVAEIVEQHSIQLLHDYDISEEVWRNDCEFGEGNKATAEHILSAITMAPADPLADPRVVALVEAAKRILVHRKDVEADVLSAHRNRGDGASEWMREDDRDFRRDLGKAFDETSAALSALEGKG